MKFICDKSLLARKIVTAQEIATKQGAIAILSNVLLSITGDKLTIKATDDTVNFITSINVEGQENGSTVVFCNKLLAILNSLPNGEMEFVEKDKVNTIKALNKKISYRLNTLASDDFPIIQTITNDTSFKVDPATFKSMISQTIFAVSNDTNRYFMCGIFLTKRDDELIAVATNARRLSLAKTKVDSGIADILLPNDDDNTDTSSSMKRYGGIIIPTKPLYALLKILSDDDTLQITITGNKIAFKFADMELQTNLIDGRFPNYTKVIPESQANWFTFNHKEMLDALKRIKIMNENGSKKIIMTLKNGTLAITASDSQLGSAVDEIDCSYSGNDCKIAFNFDFIYDALKVLQNETTTFGFSELEKAVTLKDDGEENYYHIIMPMTIGEDD